MAKVIETRWGTVTVPELSDLPDPKRPYVKDERDLAAYRLYAQGGFHPPERPNGFLDEAEERRWKALRDAAERRGGG